MQVLIGFVSLLIGWAVLIIAFWYVLQSGRIISGFLIGWGLSIICIILVSVVLPLVVSVYNDEYVLYFPDATGVGAVVLVGWAPVLVVVGVAKLIGYGSKRFRPHAGQPDK